MEYKSRFFFCLSQGVCKLNKSPKRKNIVSSLAQFNHFISKVNRKELNCSIGFISV